MAGWNRPQSQSMPSSMGYGNGTSYFRHEQISQPREIYSNQNTPYTNTLTNQSQYPSGYEFPEYSGTPNSVYTPLINEVMQGTDLGQRISDYWFSGGSSNEDIPDWYKILIGIYE